VFVGSTRAIAAVTLPRASTGIVSLEGFRMRPPYTPGVLTGRARAPSTPPTKGQRLTDIANRQVLRVGYLPDSVPYAFFNAQGELIGYDIEMANMLGRDLNVSLEFVETSREHVAEDLVSGACDIIMSGFVVSVNRARGMELSRPYEQERLGFLVPDYARGRFASLAPLENAQLMIGIPAIDDMAPMIRQRLSAATFRRFPSIDALVAALPREVEAVVLPIDRAFYLSRTNPELSAVLPEETTSTIMLAYAMPQGELEFQNVVNAWIDVKLGQHAFDSARAYWVRGEGLRPRQPRWSIARNVLGWQR
jgi:ABC-type amino acid transport substrate-binding protein